MATVASLLRDRATLHLRSVGRIFLHAYVPALQCEGQVVRFLPQRGSPIPSPAALGKIGEACKRAIEDYARRHDIPVVQFTKRQNNRFGSCSDATKLQPICDRLDAGAIQTFILRWLNKLPSPFIPEDREAGYHHDIALRQLEVSDTRVFDRPATGRAWFERVIRDLLDLGRPHSVSLIFGRRITRQTPRRFATHIITRHVDPAIQIHYKPSKAKQYFKEGRALRTQTTVNDTRDFGVGRLLRAENSRALRAAGEDANRRLIELECSAEGCAPDRDTLERVVLPSSHDGLPAPALRFGDPRPSSPPWPRSPTPWRGSPTLPCAPWWPVSSAPPTRRGR